jgi:hypothetical protein
MGIYRVKNSRALAALDTNRFDNQVVLSGENEQILVQTGIFSLEFLEAELGTTVTIKDGNGITIASGVSSFSQDHKPLKCEYGIKIVGKVSMAKGSIYEGIFQK